MSITVLYLDFDGVLHHDAVYRHPRRGIYIDQVQAPHRVLFEWSEHLVVLLEPYPTVKIVLSTTWVKTVRFSHAAKCLPLPLRERVIGATYHSRHHKPPTTLGTHWTGMSAARGAEVLADVARRKPDAWVAIDDTDEGWTDASRDHLVLCDSARGLGSPRKQHELRTMLERHFGHQSNSRL